MSSTWFRDLVASFWMLRDQGSRRSLFCVRLFLYVVLLFSFVGSHALLQRCGDWDQAPRHSSPLRYRTCASHRVLDAPAVLRENSCRGLAVRVKPFDGSLCVVISECCRHLPSLQGRLSVISPSPTPGTEIFVCLWILPPGFKGVTVCPLLDPAKWTRLTTGGQILALFVALKH